MSLDYLESSEASSRPIALYEFSYGNLVWMYNSSDRPITIGPNTYLPLASEDDGIKQTGEQQQDRLTITVATTAGFVSLFDGTPPGDPVNVRVRLTNLGLMPFPGALLSGAQQLAMDAPIAWVGLILSVKRIDPSKAEVLCETLAQTFEKNSLRLSWTRNCPYMLYDLATCGANKDSFGVACTAGTITGTTIFAEATVAYPDGDFANGFIEWTTEGGAFERRAVQQNTAGTITIIGLTDGLSADQAFIIYPGCDRTVSRCEARFFNLSNNGSAPAMPGISPFDGTLIY